MTAYQAVILRCDHHACRNEFQLRGPYTVREMRQAAVLDAGWTRRGAYDLCPTHAQITVRTGRTR